MSNRLLLGLPVAIAIAALVVVLAGAGSSPEQANAGVVPSAHVIWGDTDCNATIGASDVIAALASSAGLPPQPNQCSNGLQVGTTIHTVVDLNAPATRLPYAGLWGDTSCDGSVTLIDTMNTLRYLAVLAYDVNIGCIDLGSDTDIDIGPTIPEPGPISQLGIDTDTTGNAANSLGDIQTCRETLLDDTFDVDVFAKGMPEYNGTLYGSGGLGGFDFDFVYDPAIFRVTAVDDVQMLGVGVDNIIRYTDAVPDTDGRFHIRAYDSSYNYEHGDGVLARVTLKAIANGHSEPAIEKHIPAEVPVVVDRHNWIYNIDSVTAATISVGIADWCGLPTPTASPTASPAPTPGADNECLNIDPPLEIPDNDPVGITQTFHLDSDDEITSLSVCLNVAAQWAGDIMATLTHVDTGTTRALVDRLGNSVGTCSGGGNGIYVYLTDDPPDPQLSLEDACTNAQDIIGTFFPNQPLVSNAGTSFLGESTAGDWTLTISDNQQGGTAELRGWRLVFTE